MPELRFSALRREWVAYAGERNERTFLPTTDHCPLCPSGPGGGTEVPLSDFEVVAFENRFPALGPDWVDGHPVRPATTGCEVIVYTSEHHLTLAELPVERVRLLVDVWADRYRALGSRPEVAYVYIFENKGVEMGVTLHHPHGQIYAMPFVPPVAERELMAAEEHRRHTGRCIYCDEIRREAASPRFLFEDEWVVSFVPEAARWPYEVHLYPRRHAASIPELDNVERWALSRALLRVTGAYDRHFGFATPYVMVIHQAPTDGSEPSGAHLHVEFYPPHRRPDRLKYLAGVELGAGTWVNDTYPETTAAELRAADAFE
jgi:UDPglucose--hexose-1-phosphate uridylyltransferase